ncbi:MAG TPA: hypothetical protein VNK49_06160 [Anaerolineales bacterium]|nr:hypothetical protein [Anaerolineales bacterium]
MIETLYNLVSILLCSAPFCLFMLAFVGMAFLFFRVISSQWTPPTAEQMQAKANELEARVNGMVGRLSAWRPDALDDLSTDWDATWSRFGSTLNARGVIPSHSRPKEAAYVTFALWTRGASQPEGILYARTSRHVFEYRLSRAGVEISVDKALLGRLQPDGQLLDAERRVIGEAKRPGGMPVLFQIGPVSVVHDERAPDYPLILNGRRVGQIANPPVQRFNFIQLQRATPPLAVVPAPDISEQEALWLTALAILQVAGWNVIESVWTASRVHRPSFR